VRTIEVRGDTPDTPPRLPGTTSMGGHQGA
jgi:hypothetical protein